MHLSRLFAAAIGASALFSLCFGVPSEQKPVVVVRSGAVTLKVSDFAAARASVTHIAETAGGHVVAGQVRVTEKGKQHGWIRLEVPTAQLDSSMNQLRRIGVLFGDSEKARVLTQDAQDLLSRTVRLQQHQDRLSGVLRESHRLRGSDILFVQDRLLRAGVDQDSLGHQREQLIESATESNISVELFEPYSLPAHKVIPKTLSEKAGYAFGTAWTSFGKFMAGVGMTFAQVVVFALVWVPALLALWFVSRRLRPRVAIWWARVRPRTARPLPPTAL